MDRPRMASTTAAFRDRRAQLIGDIGLSFERVLASANQLNRSLEAVVTVGNEFASVDALWAQFEGVMGRDQQQQQQQQPPQQQQQQQQEQQHPETEEEEDASSKQPKNKGKLAAGDEQEDA